MQRAAISLRLPDGAAGTRETLKAMKLLVLDGKRQPIVRQTACAIVQNCPRMDWVCEVECCWRWVLENIRYVRDTSDVELLHFAEQILAQRCGDCDDASVLLASILESIGCATRFRALAFQGINYAHVLVEAFAGGDWIALDATEPEDFGWFPPGVTAIMELNNRECS